MEVLGLLGLLVFLYWFIAPAAAWVRASALKAKVEVLERMLATQAKDIASLRRQVLLLGEQGSAGVAAAPADADVAAATAATANPSAQTRAAPTEAVFPAATAATAAPARQPPPAQRSERAVFELEPLSTPAPVTAAPDALPAQPVLDISPAAISATPGEPTAVPANDKSPASAAWSLEPIEEAPAPTDASDATASAPLEASVAEPVVATASPAEPSAQTATKPTPSAPSPRPQAQQPQPARPPARPRPPAPPSAVEQFLQAAKGWLFGGNLVAKIGLMILFIGVAFLLRYASNYVVVPIEFRLAGIAMGAIALLGWGWRIRERRPGIALPVQGAALATLMLVTFGAYKIYGLLLPLPTFAMLLVLVLFTCILAVLQNALWLAVFGIVGGFAVPILTSSGDGNHIALFSYYALLNAGILAIAWHRAWRVLNVLGFLFTFLIGSAWGVMRYEPEHYASAQAFLALFLLFYIAIAVLYAWRQAPKLKSTVDATLVFGVPTVAMALQFGLVREFHLGAALSALAMGLLYALVAMALWRWRSGSLRLLVESFFAVAVVFGTLAIPLAFDGRWTSAAWALQGAGMVWLGLRQKQALVWRFGIALQVGSWVAFMVALSDLDPLSALRGHISLGFLLLGGSALFLALCFLQRTRAEGGAIGVLATAFVGVAVCWLLAGLWVEVWLRVTGVHRASLLVLTALLLVLGLQWLARRAQWRVPDVLAGAVTALASVVFLVLMLRYLRWDNVAVYSEQSLGEILSNSGLLGAALLSGGALASAFAFKRQMVGLQTQVLDASGPARAAGGWLLLAAFWWCGFVLYGGAHVLAWLTSSAAGAAEPWYQVSFLAGYAVALALSAYGWMALAWRFGFPNRGWMLNWFWPALSALGAWIYLLQVTPELRTEHALDFRWALAPAGDGSVVDAHLALLGGSLLGGLILLLLCWIGLRWMARENPAISAEQRSSGKVIWMIGLIAVAYLLPLDALAQWTTQTLLALDLREDDIRAWLGYADARLIWTGALAAAALGLARSIGPQALRWLALPAAAVLALAWLVLVGRAYLIHEAPATGTLLALLLAWLAQAWCMTMWLQRWPMPRPSLQALHWARVIGPWLLLAPVVSAYLMPWLAGEGSPAAAEGWVLAGMWPDYLAAWLALALLFAGLRQLRREGWPLAPLQTWYGNLVIPLAALMMLLQVVYWNLRQDGSMAPLPYLPLLNPLDLSSAFVALLLFDLWRTQREQIGAHTQRLLQRGAMALAFGWFNLMLLRTAAQYLELPYRFAALYQSQFVQAMLSLVWTLCAFALMRYAVRRMSKPLWMLGAALLAVVVLKLFLVDLRNVGGIARIVSFMGVGGLMLLIGYLAPLPTQTDKAREETS